MPLSAFFEHNFFWSYQKYQIFTCFRFTLQGFTLPGTTVVCGDSHTATHGAFGSLAFGIGTSEVEHVLATQTLLQKRAKNMRIEVRIRAEHAWDQFCMHFFELSSIHHRTENVKYIRLHSR
jgi:hypothetical protein